MKTMVTALIPPEYIYGKIADGDGYLVNEILTLPASESQNVHIKNPHSDKVMWIVGIDIFSTGDQNFYVHDQFDSITTGTEIGLQNALMDEENGGPDSGPFKAYTNSTFTATQTYPIGFSRSNPNISNVTTAVAQAIEPGRQMVIEFDNQDAGERETFFGMLILSSY